MFTPDQPINDDYKETEWVTCPDCNGQCRVFDGFNDDGTPIIEVCGTCRGEGEIELDEDNYDWD